MRQQSIPTAEARAFTDPDAAEEYIRVRDEPVVVKAAGLAKGKGVTVCYRTADALEAVDQIMRKKVFGDAGARVVIEEMLSGPECSILAFVDRKNIYVMETSQDHKPVDDGDTGPMTGGMGAYSPTPVVTDEMLRADRARHPGAGRGRAGPRGDRIQGRALCRADAHVARAQGAGIQLPLRRSRNPAADDAPAERSAGGDARRGRREARSGRAEVGPAAGDVRGGRQRRISGEVHDRHPHHRHRRRRRHARRQGLPGRHAIGRQDRSSPTAAACWA